MRARLFILVVSSLQIVGCQGQALCSNESRAITAASDLLTKQRLSHEYVVARAHATDSGDKWIVLIPRVVKDGVLVMPAQSLVEVKKADCSSRRLLDR